MSNEDDSVGAEAVAVDPALAQKKEAALAKLIETVDESELGSIKSVVSGVVRIINDPKATIKDLKEVIEIDPPLTAKVLTVANSVYYGTPRKIFAIDQAVIWIGFEALREITLHQKVLEAFQKEGDHEGYSRSALWRHSVATAILGKMIYRLEFRERGENVYAAGLLHDIGLIVEDQFLHPGFVKALDLAKQEKLNLAEAETEVLEYEHTEVAEALASHWNLPEELVTAMRRHHSISPFDTSNIKLAMTLYTADHLVMDAGIGYKDAPNPSNSVFANCISQLGLQRAALKLIVAQMKDEIRRLEDLGFFHDD
jgi:putative nucleotidyltransferase with HDIG domain